MSDDFGLSNEEKIQALQLVSERRRISQDLLKAQFGSSAKVINVINWLEMNGFINKPEGSERWEILYDKIGKYLADQGVPLDESKSNELDESDESEDDELNESFDTVYQSEKTNLNIITKKPMSDDVLFMLLGGIPNIIVGFWLLCLIALDKSNSPFAGILMGVGLLSIVVFLGTMLVKLGFEQFVEYVMILVCMGMFVYPAMFVIGGMILGSMGYL